MFSSGVLFLSVSKQTSCFHFVCLFCKSQSCIHLLSLWVCFNKFRDIIRSFLLTDSQLRLLLNNKLQSLMFYVQCKHCLIVVVWFIAVVVVIVVVVVGAHPRPPSLLSPLLLKSLVRHFWSQLVFESVTCFIWGIR